MAKRNTAGMFGTLLELATEQFAYNSENIPKEKGEVKVFMNGTVKFGVDDEKHQIGCGFKFELTNTDEKQILVIECIANFSIDEKSFKKQFDKRRNVFTFPKNEACNLFNLTVGFTRGVLHAKTEGTDLNRFFIPLVNPDEYVPGDIEVFTKETIDKKK